MFGMTYEEKSHEPEQELTPLVHPSHQQAVSQHALSRNPAEATDDEKANLLNAQNLREEHSTVRAQPVRISERRLIKRANNCNKAFAKYPLGISAIVLYLYYYIKSLPALSWSMSFQDLRNLTAAFCVRAERGVYVISSIEITGHNIQVLTAPPDIEFANSSPSNGKNTAVIFRKMKLIELDAEKNPIFCAHLFVKPNALLRRLIIAPDKVVINSIPGRPPVEIPISYLSDRPDPMPGKIVRTGTSLRRQWDRTGSLEGTPINGVDIPVGFLPNGNLDQRKGTDHLLSEYATFALRRPRYFKPGLFIEDLPLLVKSQKALENLIELIKQTRVSWCTFNLVLPEHQLFAAKDLIPLIQSIQSKIPNNITFAINVPLDESALKKIDWTPLTHIVHYVSLQNDDLCPGRNITCNPLSLSKTKKGIEHLVNSGVKAKQILPGINQLCPGLKIKNGKISKEFHTQYDQRCIRKNDCRPPVAPLLPNVSCNSNPEHLFCISQEADTVLFCQSPESAFAIARLATGGVRFSDHSGALAHTDKDSLTRAVEKAYTLGSEQQSENASWITTHETSSLQPTTSDLMFSAALTSGLVVLVDETINHWAKSRAFNNDERFFLRQLLRSLILLYLFGATVGGSGIALMILALPLLKKMGFSESVESIIYGMTTSGCIALRMTAALPLVYPILGGVAGGGAELIFMAASDFVTGAGEEAIQSSSGQKLLKPFISYIIDPMADGMYGYVNALWENMTDNSVAATAAHTASCLLKNVSTTQLAVNTGKLGRQLIGGVNSIADNMCHLASRAVAPLVKNTPAPVKKAAGLVWNLTPRKIANTMVRGTFYALNSGANKFGFWKTSNGEITTKTSGTQVSIQVCSY